MFENKFRIRKQVFNKKTNVTESVNNHKKIKRFSKLIIQSSIWDISSKKIDQVRFKKKHLNKKFNQDVKKIEPICNLQNLQKENYFKRATVLWKKWAVNNLKSKVLNISIFKSSFKEIDSIYNLFMNIKEIGSGSYAIAYLAQSKKSNFQYVLKSFKLKNFIKNNHVNRFMVI